MKVILSIKPKFAASILDGSKFFEYRRSIFKNAAVKTVIIYASAPISKVIGQFDVGIIRHQRLEALWERTKEGSGITKEYFDQYFEGKQKGYAIRIEKPIKYINPLCIKKHYGLSPPQSFVYVKAKKKQPCGSCQCGGCPRCNGSGYIFSH